MNQGIDWRESNNRVVNWATFGIVGARMISAVDVENENYVGKGANCDYQHNKEDLDVFHYLRDHSDEGRERLEKSHPVEELDPHNENSYRADYLQIVVRDLVGHFNSYVESVNDEGTKIHYVPSISEVSQTFVPHLYELQEQKPDVCLSADDKADDLKNEMH
jgi:hypothetical protein